MIVRIVMNLLPTPFGLKVVPMTMAKIVINSFKIIYSVLQALGLVFRIVNILSPAEVISLVKSSQPELKAHQYSKLLKVSNVSSEENQFQTVTNVLLRSRPDRFIGYAKRSIFNYW